MSAEKAKYRVLRLSHIHNNLWPEGQRLSMTGCWLRAGAAERSGEGGKGEGNAKGCGSCCC